MLSLLILLVVGACAEGQRQQRVRQGFRPRGFVPQEEVYASEHYSRDDQQKKDLTDRQGNVWNGEESAGNAVSQSKREQVWDSKDYDDGVKNSPHHDDGSYRHDEDQTAAQERRQYRYPTFDHQPNQFKTFTTPIPILRLDKEQRLDGSYKTSYETGNSIIHEETGFMKPHGSTNNEMLVQQGSYSYTDAEGNVFTVRYTADEQGFRAHGDHFPTPPPIPPEIQRGLDIIYEQIRLDAERRQSEQKYEDGDSRVDNHVDYTAHEEQKTHYNQQYSQEQQRNHFRNTVNQNQHIQQNRRNVQQQQPTIYNRHILRDVRGSQRNEGHHVEHNSRPAQTVQHHQRDHPVDQYSVK